MVNGYAVTHLLITAYIQMIVKNKISIAKVNFKKVISPDLVKIYRRIKFTSCDFNFYKFHMPRSQFV